MRPASPPAVYAHHLGSRSGVTLAPVPSVSRCVLSLLGGSPGTGHHDMGIIPPFSPGMSPNHRGACRPLLVLLPVRDHTPHTGALHLQRPKCVLPLSPHIIKLICLRLHSRPPIPSLVWRQPPWVSSSSNPDAALLHLLLLTRRTQPLSHLLVSGRAQHGHRGAVRRRSAMVSMRERGRDAHDLLQSVVSKPA